MSFHELPPEVLDMLVKYVAPPRLVAHLTVVYDAAIALVKHLDASWPVLEYDRERVLMGAATHDLGKVVYTNELTGPGIQHEEIGPQLLLENGFQEAYARFALTHAQWNREPVVQLEDVLVAFADTIWKGKRDEVLEKEIAQHIAKQSNEEIWQVYMMLDDIACDIAKDAHDRVLWQGNYTL